MCPGQATGGPRPVWPFCNHPFLHPCFLLHVLSRSVLRGWHSRCSHAARRGGQSDKTVMWKTVAKVGCAEARARMDMQPLHGNEFHLSEGSRSRDGSFEPVGSSRPGCAQWLLVTTVARLRKKQGMEAEVAGKSVRG